ncbi:MAG TPA: VOC family protein [Vicinamibacterales bacterium]|nr:VOC family protein [Vicinamibacterales bacterium]
MRDVEQLVDGFVAGRLTRRDLIASVTALVAGAARPQAQTAAAAKGKTLNHVSLAVSDVDKAAAFYSKVLDLQVVSRPGNGGINLGLGTSFLGVYKLANPGTINHCCIGVDDYDPERIAAKLQEQGIRATIDRNPANRTSGGDQLYFVDPDGLRVQLSANGYQG